MLIIIGASLLLFFIWASADVGSGVYLKALCRQHTNRPVVALSFDDGPDPEMTPRVLDVLKKHDVKATFFLKGSHVLLYPELTRRIVKEGHIVGNHSFSHSPAFPLWCSERVTREIYDTEKALIDTIGMRPLLFRPPFGVTNPIIASAVRKSGLLTIGWSIRSLDTNINEERAAVCRRIRKRLHNGAVILLHDRCPNADILLDTVLTEIRNSGRSVVALESLFDIKCYDTPCFKE